MRNSLRFIYNTTTNYLKKSYFLKPDSYTQNVLKTKYLATKQRNKNYLISNIILLIIDINFVPILFADEFSSLGNRDIHRKEVKVLCCRYCCS